MTERHTVDHHDEPGLAVARKDPVCGMDVAPDSPHRLEHGGFRYVFCSRRCLEKFRDAPNQYVPHTPAERTVRAAQPERELERVPAEHSAHDAGFPDRDERVSTGPIARSDPRSGYCRMAWATAEHAGRAVGRRGSVCQQRRRHDRAQGLFPDSFRMAAQIFISWNQTVQWLRCLEGLKTVA